MPVARSGPAAGVARRRSAVRKARPERPAYLLASQKPAEGKEPPTAEGLIARAKEIGADGLDLSAEEPLDTAFAAKVRAAGLKLYVWTVNDPAVARRMAALGVDGITTDRPAWLRAKLSE